MNIEIELAAETYECAICVQPIEISAAIYSCSTCWTVFHLLCVEEWAETSGHEDAYDPDTWFWRCPGCQTNHSVFPYGCCYCGESYADEIEFFEKPHSCGNTCNRTVNCIHPCQEICHGGACLPCREVIEVSCHCQKESSLYDCSEGISSFECGKICERILSCSHHQCQELCHPGPCKPCTSITEQACNCGKSTRSVQCSSNSSSDQPATLNSKFSCNQPCNLDYNCGKHKCQEICHVHISSNSIDDALECPYDPSRLLHCPCGSKSISLKESLEARATCQDPLILCDDICWKEMDCGHRCRQQCHEGACTVCLEKKSIPCRCGATSVTCICSDRTVVAVSLCTTTCRVQRHCGRHQCAQKCCPKEPVTLLNGLRTEDPHICTLTCQRRLKCGHHNCSLECHRGPCPPCAEATFTEIECACGKTKLHPPIPCGEPLYPTCDFDCILPRPCGHAFPHACHHPSTPCAPCKFLVQQSCKCGKVLIKSVVCSNKTQPSCGLVCGNLLACGHACKEICHSADDCSSSSFSPSSSSSSSGKKICSLVCGRQRGDCGHKCTHPCHTATTGLSCQEIGPCDSMVTVSCSCGLKKASKKCFQVTQAIEISRSSLLKGNDDKEEDTEKEEKEVGAVASRVSPVDANGKLWCTSECEEMKKEENRTVEYSPEMVTFAQENADFTKLIETAFTNLIGGSYKFHDFSPMKSQQQEFVEELAAFYNISTEISDPEDPFSHLVGTRTTASCCPRITLSGAVELKKKGLLLFKEGEIVENTHDIERKPRLARGFARPIPVPEIPQVQTSNSFKLLSLE
ncbi:hypothetical protein BDR26DRAFT_140120 [Obelidium mucronatum]|nr:hypothetical protein BDR26DRAFT_140120 [Obelidium mucronatum]